MLVLECPNVDLVLVMVLLIVFECVCSLELYIQLWSVVYKVFHSGRVCVCVCVRVRGKKVYGETEKERRGGVKE